MAYRRAKGLKEAFTFSEDAFFSVMNVSLGLRHVLTTRGTSRVSKHVTGKINYGPAQEKVQLATLQSHIIF